MFELITPLSYWVLTILWGGIFGLYLAKLKGLKVASGAVTVLLSILAIDAFRTVFESAYFGLYFNSMFGLLPRGVYDVLSQPGLIIIPKLLNVAAGLIVLFLLIHRWVPREIREREEWILDLQESQREANEKKAEAERQSSYLEAVFNGISDAIILTDTDRRIVSTNRGVEKTFGYVTDDVAGKTTAMLYESEEEYERQGRIRFNLSAEEKSKPYIVSYRRKDGEVFPGETIGTVITGQAGEILGYFGVIRDITQRERAEEVLRDSEAHMRLALENVTVGNIIINDKGIVEIFNSTAGEIFGYTMDEVVGQNVSILMPDPDRENHDRYIQNYLETGKGEVIGVGREVTGLRKNGENFPMHIGVGEITIGGRRSFIGTIIDLSEAKYMEAQLIRSQKMKAIGELSGGIAHDFNNLLGIIVGNLEVAAEQIDPDSKAKVLVDKVLAAADKGTALTHRLLAFSSKQSLATVVTDVNNSISGLIELLARTLGEHVELKTILANNAWLALTDNEQLEHALINLAINARDAMAEGGKLVIETSNVTLDMAYAKNHKDVSPGDYVLIQVSDTGVGMSAEVIERVFDPFFTTKKFGTGSGLGLSMVFGFAKQSNGYVSIYSEEGIGTTVNLYLPRAKTEKAADGNIANEVVETFIGKARILVVEDDPDVREIPVMVLSEGGYEVVEAEDGKSAVEHLENGPPFDLLFTDVVLPHGMTGVDIADEALRLQPGIRILFTTGYTENVSALSNRIREGAGLITKPYRGAELLKKVNDILKVEESER